jgi:hypothetical protein
MIVEVFITQCQAVDPLAHQLPHRVIHINLLAPVGKTFGQPLGQTQRGVGLAQQEHAAIAGKRATGKIGLHLTGSQIIKEKGLLGGDHVSSLWARYGKSNKIFIKSAGHPAQRTDSKTLRLFSAALGGGHRLGTGGRSVLGTFGPGGTAFGQENIRAATGPTTRRHKLTHCGPAALQLNPRKVASLLVENYFRNSNFQPTMKYPG